MFSAGYDIGSARSPTRTSKSAPSGWSRTRSRRRSTRWSVPVPHAGGAPRPHDRRRPGAGAVVRPARRARRSQARDAPGEARARLLAHGPAPLHRRDRRRPHARAVPARAPHRRRHRAAWGLVNRVAAAEELEPSALELAGELAGNAPLAQTGNKRVIARAAARRERAAGRLEAELIELRRASFASQDLREGMRAFAERRPRRAGSGASVRRPSATPHTVSRMAPLITREEALQLGEIEDHDADRSADRARLAGARRALRRLDRHVLAGQRQVRRLRRGLRLLRAVALRRRRDADARDDGARADPRARARGRGRRRPPLLHGHAGPGPLQARLRASTSRASGSSPSRPT